MNKLKRIKKLDMNKYIYTIILTCLFILNAIIFIINAIADKKQKEYFVNEYKKVQASNTELIQENKELKQQNLNLIEENISIGKELEKLKGE